MKTRRVTASIDADPYSGLVHVHATSCYDFLVSLRAAFNPRTYEATRIWAAEARRRLSPEGRERGRFFFQGPDTSLGYGITRLVAGLAEDAHPRELIDRIRAEDARGLALTMLDSGESDGQNLAVFERAMSGSVSNAALDRALRGASAASVRRSRRVLAEPQAIQAELIALLEEYLQSTFESEIEHVRESCRRGAARAKELLSVVPTAAAIEQLTGGYTVGTNLALTSVTLAPSAFIHPYMASRVDERTGQALIVFGVPSDALLRFDTVPIDPGLVRAAKALGDQARLKVLRLLGEQPMTGLELAATLGVTPPTLHHHLHQLRVAGLVRQERAKGGMQYAIRRDSALGILDAMERLIVGDEPTTIRSSRAAGGRPTSRANQGETQDGPRAPRTGRHGSS